MSKYQPLWDYVESHAPSVLTYAEIESILGFPIDHSFLTFKKELTRFRVGKISMKNQTVTFIQAEENP